MRDLMIGILTVVASAGAAIVLAEAVHWAVRRIGRRSPLAADLARTAHHPFLATLTLFSVQQAVRWQAGDFPARGPLLHLMVVLFIAGFAWLAAAAVLG